MPITTGKLNKQRAHHSPHPIGLIPAAVAIAVAAAVASTVANAVATILTSSPCRLLPII